MVNVPPELRLGLSVFAALVAGSLVAYLFQHRDRAAARSLLGVGIAVLLASIIHLAVADLSAPKEALALTGWQLDETLWVVVGNTATIVSSGIWSVFALQYTGRSRRVIRTTTVAVALLSAGAIGVTVVSVETAPAPVLFQILTVLFLLSGFLVIIGVFLLLWASAGQNAFPFREPIVLSAGALALLSGIFVAQVFEQPVLFPALLSVAGGLFLVPVVRYPIFETLPAARVAGRDRVVEELREGVLIVDRNGRVRDLNPAAESLFDMTGEAVLETPLSTVLPTIGELPTLVAKEEPIRVETEGGTPLEIWGDRITDQRGRSVGYLLLCVDVTDRLRREERLTLLSQFVADVVRDRMAEIARDAAIQASNPDSAPGQTLTASRIWDRTTELTTLVAQTRAIEAVIADRESPVESRLDVQSQLDKTIEAVATSGGPTVTTSVPQESVVWEGDSELFQLLLDPVVNDAYEHAATRVEIQADVGGDLTIQVSDDRQVTSERETNESLGDLSIAVARLALEQLGGDLAVHTSDDGLRRVTARFPTAGRPGDSEPNATTSDGGAV